MATSREYWKNRWLQTHLDLERRNAPRIEDVEQLFADLELEVLEDLTKWYERYATNDGLTKEEASKMLSKVEQRNWSVTLKEFRERAIKGGYENLLNREYYNSRVTRLKMINTQMKMHMFEMANERESYMHSILTDEFHENYMRSTFEIHSQQGKILDNRINVDFARYNQKEVDLVLQKPWKGSTFSKRVWGNDTKYLPDQLQKTLANGLTKGHGIDRMVKDFDERFDVAKGRAVTLVQSETKHIKTQAELASMKENGVSRYIYLATLETNTCSTCGKLDSRDFPIDDAVPGENCPVIHPNCRCAIIPMIDEALRSNTRWARDPRTGLSIRVSRMSYGEWKEKYALTEGQKRLKDGLDRGTIKAEINNEKQNRHVKGTDEYERRVQENSKKNRATPSYITVSNDEAQKLVDRYKTLGEVELRRNQTVNKEIVQHNSVIGVHVNQNTGLETETNAFRIHYSKTGSHIVPTLKGDD